MSLISPGFTVHIDDRRINAAIQLLNNQAPAAIARAFKRSGTAMRTQAIEVVRDETTIGLAAVRKAIPAPMLTRGTGTSVILRISGKEIGLINYTPKRTPQGVTVQVKKSKGRKLVRHAFLATMKSGHKGVFVRKTVGEKMVGRLPIKELFSTTVADMLNNETVLRRILRHGANTFSKELTHEIKFRLNKRISA